MEITRPVLILTGDLHRKNVTSFNQLIMETIVKTPTNVSVQVKDGRHYNDNKVQQNAARYTEAMQLFATLHTLALRHRSDADTTAVSSYCHEAAEKHKHHE